jgi:hypothetical protein
MVAVTGDPVAFTAIKLGILPAPLAPSPIVVLLFVQVYIVFATGPLIVTAAVADPAHTAWFAIAFTAGVGFTVIVKLTGVPVQAPTVDGVTVMVAVIGAVVLLVAVKLAILPVPLAANPIAVLLFVQLYTVPATLPVKLTAAVGLPLHSNWLAGWLTLAVGFTVIVNVVDGPAQLMPPLVNTGVTVIVAVTAVLPVLIAVNDGIVLVPLAPSPMDRLLLVQLYTVPATGPAIVTAVVFDPAHTVWLAIVVTDGVGFTVIVNVIGVPVQVVAPLVNVGVTVIVAVCTTAVALVAVKLAILPVPDAARPIVVLLLVQLYTVPATLPVKFTAVVALPLHSTCGNTAFTVGTGFTVMVNVCGVPVQVPPLLV